MSVPTPHIAAEKGQIAKTVLMPGDPLRAKFIAETFLEGAVLVNNVRVPRRDRAAHLAQASCLRGHANGEGAAKSAGCGLVDGDRDGRIGDARREREDTPIELRHREGV